MQILNSWAITAIFFSLSQKVQKGRMDLLFMEVFGVFCFFLFYVNLKHRLLSEISVIVKRYTSISDSLVNLQTDLFKAES